MYKKMRVMTETPLNAETPLEYMQSWVTANEVFFKRNQGKIMESPVDLDTYTLSVEGLVAQSIALNFSDILALPKIEVANTLECSGNSRSLLEKKAPGNPWIIGGVGNAVWGGVRLADVLDKAGVSSGAAHVSFEGMDIPLGKAGIKFIRSIPIEKAMDSTILAYEMNGEPLPLEHGFPLRALALGWTGANCVKWVNRIMVLDSPQEGFFMDRAYRIFQKGEDPKSGKVITGISVKSIITSPEREATLSPGKITVRGAAYAGEADVEKVEISTDDGATWDPVEFIGPHEHYAWRRWEFNWTVSEPGNYTIMARATDSNGAVQPDSALWNALGYENNGIREHSVSVQIRG